MFRSRLAWLAVLGFVCSPVLADGSIPRLGIAGRFVDRDSVRALFGVDFGGGAVLVESVEKDSPAERAGLRGGSVPADVGGERVLLGGDLILGMEAHPVCTGDCLMAGPGALTRPEKVGVTFFRGGVVLSAVIDLERPILEPIEIGPEDPVGSTQR